MKTNINPYDKFAEFYRELIKTTGRLNDENNLLEKLVDWFQIDKKANILDAACGTGDALSYLAQKGFCNLAGLDGSNGMLTKAREILGSTPLFHCEWKNLSKHYKYNKTNYDLIFILSNSLLHSEVENIPKIIESLYKMLSPGGYLIFDVRKWMFLSNGSLVETNRTINNQRFLANVQFEGSKWSVKDECKYIENRQIIYYICSELSNKPERTFQIEVSYALAPVDFFLSSLRNVGFKETIIFDCEYWPYLILCSSTQYNWILEKNNHDY